MADVNITKVYLLNTPLENDYKQTLYFASPSDQYSYFYGRRVSGCSFTDFSYQRKDSVIRVPVHYDTLVAAGVNYVMYQNTAYNHTFTYDGTDYLRWQYAFITRMEYKDDGRTDLYIETDVMQTWMFDITVKPSFVEREHCDDDTVGLHTYPEQLETGEYVCNGHITDSNLNNTDDKPYMIVFGVTEYQDGTKAGGKRYNGIYSGVDYRAYTTGQYESVAAVLKSYDNNGKADAVTCMFLAPYFLCGEWGGSDSDTVPASSDTQYYTKTILTNTAMDGYGSDIKNNKLKCFPYNYLLVTNNAGGSAVYQYEHFYSEKTGEKLDPEFKVEGVLTPGCSIRLVPTHYKGAALNDDEGLNLGKFPICNWQSDVYTNWLTQNSVNIAVGAVGNIATIGGGLALMATGAGSFAGASAVTSGVMGIAGQIGQVYQQSLQPPQVNGNLNCGDVITASERNTFHFYNMSIKKEYAQIIDNYFTMFGYKTCLVKTPNYNHREHFWYTKTIDVNIDGKVPNTDMQIIKNCYNTGITFWRNDGTFGNYSVTNSIV